MRISRSLRAAPVHLLASVPALGVLALGVLACGSGPSVTGGPFTGDPANFTYELDGKSVTLVNGAHEEKTGTGVDDVLATDLTQASLDADFDGNATTDRAVVLTRDDGPMKVHYLVAFTGEKTTTSLVLGKNVLVKRLSLGPKGGIAVTMLTRDEGVPVDQPPTLEVTRTFVMKEGKLVAK